MADRPQENGVEPIFVTTHADGGARVGRLLLRGRKVIQTPHYIANASRGVIPHITPDTLADQTDISGVYMALEDCKWQSLVWRAMR